MDVEQLFAKLSAYLENPGTVYQVCAATGLGFSAISNYLKILEAAGKVKHVRSAKKTLWMLAHQEPQASGKPEASKEDGEVEAH